MSFVWLAAIARNLIRLKYSKLELINPRFAHFFKSSIDSFGYNGVICCFLAKQPKIIINNHVVIKMSEPRVSRLIFNPKIRSQFSSLSPLNPNLQHLTPMPYLLIADAVDGAVFPECGGAGGRERGVILIAGVKLYGEQAEGAGAVIGFQL